MEIEGTKEAFLQLLSERGIHNRLGVERSTVSGWKKRGATIDKMEEILLKAGASVVCEKVWEIEDTVDSPRTISDNKLLELGFEKNAEYSVKTGEVHSFSIIRNGAVISLVGTELRVWYKLKDDEFFYSLVDQAPKNAKDINNIFLHIDSINKKP